VRYSTKLVAFDELFSYASELLEELGGVRVERRY
jgi:hypothetical protein